MGARLSRRLRNGGVLLDRASRNGSQFAAQREMSWSRRAVAGLGNEAEARASLEKFKRGTGPSPESPAVEIANSSQPILREKEHKKAQGPEKIAPVIDACERSTTSARSGLDNHRTLCSCIAGGRNHHVLGNLATPCGFPYCLWVQEVRAGGDAPQEKEEGPVPLNLLVAQYE